MKKFFYPLVALIAISQLSSCASIFCGSKSKVTLCSEVDKADKVTVDSKIYKNITFPYSIKITRGFSDSVIKAEKKGYDPAMIYVDKTFNGVSILSILCGVVPVAIDAATGAMMKPEHNTYEIDFTPISDKK